MLHKHQVAATQAQVAGAKRGDFHPSDGSTVTRVAQHDCARGSPTAVLSRAAMYTAAGQRVPYQKPTQGGDLLRVNVEERVYGGAACHCYILWKECVYLQPHCHS